MLNNVIQVICYKQLKLHNFSTIYRQFPLTSINSHDIPEISIINHMGLTEGILRCPKTKCNPELCTGQAAKRSERGGFISIHI